jgi:hypothetical protein
VSFLKKKEPFFSKEFSCFSKPYFSILYSFYLLPNFFSSSEDHVQAAATRKRSRKRRAQPRANAGP